MLGYLESIWKKLMQSTWTEVELSTFWKTHLQPVSNIRLETEELLRSQSQDEPLTQNIVDINVQNDIELEQDESQNDDDISMLDQQNGELESDYEYDMNGSNNVNHNYQQEDENDDNMMQNNDSQRRKQTFPDIRPRKRRRIS